MVKVYIIGPFGHSWVVVGNEHLVKVVQPSSDHPDLPIPMFYVFNRIQAISPFIVLSPSHRGHNGLKS